MIDRLFIFIIFTCCVCSLSGQNPRAAKITADVISGLKAADYPGVHNMLDKEMKRRIGTEELEMMWSGFIDAYDSLERIGETTSSVKDSLTLTETRIAFVKKAFKFRLSINADGQVCGLFFVNVNVPYTPPGYVNTLTFYEVKIPVPGKVTSEGILSLPKATGKVPLVIVAGGSGPTDKDGTVHSSKPYKDIAWALAASGIAVYRFDKRTANPANLEKIDLGSFTMHDEYVTDLRNIVALFRRDKRIDAGRIFILGHSQGGFMIPYFAKSIGHIKGYIGLAANFGTLLELLPRQYAYLSDSSSQETTNAMIQRCRYMAANLNSRHIDQDSCFPGLTMAYVRHMEKNKPSVLAPGLLHTPVLLVQGGRDYQVPETELELWKQQLGQSSSFSWKVFPKLNHLMMEGEGKPGPGEYNIPGNVPQYVPDEVASWIRKQ